MAKVDDMLRSYSDPMGSSWAPANEELAIVMRQILNEDIPEVDMALSIQSFNAGLSQEDLHSAWSLLSARERTTWRKYVHYDEWLRMEKLRAYQ